MNTTPYNKHQLYKGYYKMDSGGEIQLPDKCHWRVSKYAGDCSWVSDNERIGPITLLLEETYDDGGGFWSVISFLTEDEARELASQLVDAFSNIKRIKFD